MKKRLFEMLNELEGHNRTREELDLYYISNRLNKSLTNYYADLDADVDYLENRKEINVLRKLNKKL